MAKTAKQRSEDAILTVLRHTTELTFGDIALRAGKNLADPLLDLVSRGKVNRRISEDTKQSFYSINQG